MADLIERDVAVWITVETGALETQRRIKELPAVNRWIPCSDKLPGDTTCVLVTDGELMAITSYRDGEWEYHDQYGNHYELYGQITHWMPLPEPPEKE